MPGTRQQIQNQPDKDRERFAELIWTRGDEILDDLGCLRAFIADCIRDESRRDVLFAAISKGMAQDIRRCRPDDFPLRKGHWLHKLQHFAPEFAEWAIDSISYAIGPDFDPEKPYQKALTLAPEELLASLREPTERERRALERAARLFLRAAEVGHSGACFWYGELLRLGKGVQQNRVESIAWTRRAAEQGHIFGQATLGSAYLLGIGVAENVKTAVEWLTLAAEGGDATAQFELSIAYKWPTFGICDDSQSRYWLVQAANQNDEVAILDLGELCEEEGDISGALEWYKKIADSAPFSRGARQRIGAIYEKRGDISSALEWYKKIADSGGELGYQLLGEIYKKQHDIMALDWYKRLVYSGLVKVGNGCVLDHGCDASSDRLIDGSIDQLRDDMPGHVVTEIERFEVFTRTEVSNLYLLGSDAGCEICASRLREINDLAAQITHAAGCEPPEWLINNYVNAYIPPPTDCEGGSNVYCSDINEEKIVPSVVAQVLDDDNICGDPAGFAKFLAHLATETIPTVVGFYFPGRSEWSKEDLRDVLQEVAPSFAGRCRFLTVCIDPEILENEYAEDSVIFNGLPWFAAFVLGCCVASDKGGEIGSNVIEALAEAAVNFSIQVKQNRSTLLWLYMPETAPSLRCQVFAEVENAVSQIAEESSSKYTLIVTSSWERFNEHVKTWCNNVPEKTVVGAIYAPNGAANWAYWLDSPNPELRLLVDKVDTDDDEVTVVRICRLDGRSPRLIPADTNWEAFTTLLLENEEPALILACSNPDEWRSLATAEPSLFSVDYVFFADDSDAVFNWVVEHLPQSDVMFYGEAPEGGLVFPWDYADGGGFRPDQLPAALAVRIEEGELAVVDCCAFGYSPINEGETSFPGSSMSQFEHWTRGSLADLNQSVDEFLTSAGDRTPKLVHVRKTQVDADREAYKHIHPLDLTAKLGYEDDYAVNHILCAEAEKEFLANWTWPSPRDPIVNLAEMVKSMKYRLSQIELSRGSSK